MNKYEHPNAEWCQLQDSKKYIQSFIILISSKNSFTGWVCEQESDSVKLFSI